MNVRKIVFVLCLIIVNKVHGLRHFIDVFEDKDFLKKGIGFTYNVGECFNFPNDWFNRVSSANTHGQCVEIYNDVNCKGNMKYIMPGSPAHNELEILGMNDNTKSFRSCDLNQEDVCVTCDRKDRKKLVEYNFWYYFFATQGDELQGKYEKQVESDGAFTRWNFVLGDKSSLNKGDQYQEVLEWAKNVIKANVYPPDNRFCKSFMDTLVRLGDGVLNERRNEIKGIETNWNDRKYVVHSHLINLWTGLVDDFKYAISLKIHKDC